MVTIKADVTIKYFFLNLSIAVHMGKCNINSYVIPIYFMFDITHLLQDTGCFLKNAAHRSSVIYCPILINKRSNTMVKKTLQNGLIFFQH
jgi:hypothetical protein